MAAERLGVAVDQVRLIAAHAWDVAGAARAGCVTAFVARPGKVLDPLVERPEIVGGDLTEVADALSRLRDAGLRLAALTNSTEEVARAQLEHAGLIDAFELVLSADTVGRLKPAPEPYRMAAERLEVDVGEVRLIAAHAWDVAGAARAGCATAFVARPGKVLDPLVERPEIVGADLAEVADAILAADQSDNRGGGSATPAPSA